eukprot:5457699-Amphidinium_carterae.1
MACNLYRMSVCSRKSYFGFGAGGLGLELDEPELGSSEPSKRTWRLRATHPPASSLKMEETRFVPTPAANTSTEP